MNITKITAGIYLKNKLAECTKQHLLAFRQYISRNKSKYQPIDKAGKKLFYYSEETLEAAFSKWFSGYRTKPRHTSGKEINCLIELQDGAIPPRRAHATDTGDDVYAHSITIVTKDGKKFDSYIDGESILHIAAHSLIKVADIELIILDTGIAIRPQSGYASILAARSSITKLGFVVPNGIGIIDNGYSDTLKLIIRPIGTTAFDKVAVGDRIGQLIFHEVIHPRYKVVEKLPATQRGNGGFGSTGSN